METKRPSIGSTSPEEYLAQERLSPIRREYVEGHVFPRVDSSVQHSRILTNIIVFVGQRLQAGSCFVFDCNAKIRIRTSGGHRFYYPDALVVCEKLIDDDYFLDFPRVVFEIVSPETQRVDWFEKLDAYLQIPSLDVYALVDQDSAAVVIHRRHGSSFEREEYLGVESMISLPEIELELPLSEIYELPHFSEE